MYESFAKINDFEIGSHKNSQYIKENSGIHDSILFLYPYDLKAENRSGAHPGKTFRASGDDSAYDTKSNLFFATERHSVNSIYELHDVLVQASEEGLAFPVRGERAHGMPYIRRTKSQKGTSPAGLYDKPRYWMPIDIDHLPNIWKLDPRTQADELRERIAEALGAEFRDVTMSMVWSSSCCVRVPASEVPGEISLRIWVRLSRALGEQEMRQLQKRMKLRISAIDPKLADIQQPIYIAAPRFEGLEDPFFGSGRWALREGKQDALDVDTLMRNLPELGGMKAKKENAEKTHRVPVARSKSISIPGQPIPLAASAREIQALRDAQADTTISDYKNLSARFGYARVALEMAALAIHRGGLKDGERDTLGLTIAAAVVNSLDLGLSEDRVRREVRAVLQLTVSGTWIEAEWEGTADGSLVSRYLESSANFMAGKVDWDLRYLYSMKRLHQEWIPSIEEVDELGLKSLASDAQREMIRRRGEGLQEKPEDRMESRRLAPQVHDMKKNGTTLRAIAADLDISVSRVNRLLSLSAHEVDEVREWIASQDKSAIEKSEITKSIAFMEKRAVTKLELVAAIERESEQVISDEGWRKSVIRDGQIHSVITGVPPWLRRRAA